MNKRNGRCSRLADVVLEIEREMRQLDLWTPPESPDVPSLDALASTQPFCLDTLEFPQWLQFVLLVRIRELIEAGAALPERSDIAPMAEEYFQRLPQPGSRLIETIRIMDQIISD